MLRTLTVTGRRRVRQMTTFAGGYVRTSVPRAADATRTLRHITGQSPNKSVEPSGPKYSARVAFTCVRGHAPGPVLHAVQELRSTIDDRLRIELGTQYDRHEARSAGTDKLTVTLTVRAESTAEAIRLAGAAAGTLVEILTTREAAIDLSGLALVVRAG